MVWPPSEEFEEESLAFPIVHLHHTQGRQADIELSFKLKKLAPPLPNQYVGQPIEETNLHEAEEIPAIVMAEHPSKIYLAHEVDQAAEPKQNLQQLCDQIAQQYPHLFSCKSKTMRFELVIHQDGSVIDWQIAHAPYSICEPISLIFISNIQEWSPALLQSKPVTQKVSIHIHFH